MAKASQRAPVLGPAFIRLLARFKDDATAPTAPDVSVRLATWFDWNRAITLSRALDNPPAAVPPGPAYSDDQDAECARVHARLVASIQAEIVTAADAVEADPYAPYRQHYLAQQRAMQTATGNLRGRLRDMLARQSPAKARLADVDAVMEATLSPREYTLLSHVPVLLGQHYQRLHEHAATTDAPASVSPATATFLQDLRTALLAELDVRFHPIEGLLAALRTR